MLIFFKGAVLDVELEGGALWTSQALLVGLGLLARVEVGLETVLVRPVEVDFIEGGALMVAGLGGTVA